MNPLIILVFSMNFIEVTALSGDHLEISIDHITIIQPSDDSLHTAAKCVIQTDDNRLRAVKETCDEVRHRVDEAYKQREQFEQGQQKRIE